MYARCLTRLELQYGRGVWRWVIIKVRHHLPGWSLTNIPLSTNIPLPFYQAHWPIPQSLSKILVCVGCYLQGRSGFLCLSLSRLRHACSLCRQLPARMRECKGTNFLSVRHSAFSFVKGILAEGTNSPTEGALRSRLASYYDYSMVLLYAPTTSVLRPATLHRPFRIVMSSPTYRLFSWLDLPWVLPGRPTVLD